MKMKNYGIYERKGGYSTASADFILMRPTDVRLSGVGVKFVCECFDKMILIQIGKYVSKVDVCSEFRHVNL